MTYWQSLSREAAEDLTASQRSDPFDSANWQDLIKKITPGIKFGFSKPVFPVIISSYKRLRFIDPHTRNRVSLDYDIRAREANPTILPRQEVAQWNVDEWVMEVKGSVDQLPFSIKGLGFFQLTSFSKYEAVIDAVLRVPR